MTSSPDFEHAIRVIQAIAQIMADPNAEQKIRSLQGAMTAPGDWAKQVTPTAEELAKTPDRGTCPTCGKPYAFKGNVGGIRRHGKTGKCLTDTQMAAEIIPAVRLIANLGDWANGDSGERTQH